MGTSTRFDETEAGLIGTFTINRGADGDRFLDELRDGYLSGLSARFVAKVTTRAADGSREVRDADLIEVSAVALPAYDRAELLAVRSARILAPFVHRPEVNLAPIPPLWR